MEKNENIQIEGNFNNKRKDFFVIVLTFIISIIVLIVLVNALMTNSKVNEGKFRVSDVLLTSTAVLEDTRDVTSKWTFNVHQNNKISILVIPSTDAFSAKLTDIAATKSGLELYQVGHEESKINIDNTKELKIVSTVNEDGNVLYEIEFVNRNVLQNFEIPSETTEITHDATVFGLAGLTNKDLQYTVAFKLQIQDSTGKTSVMNISLKLPQGDIVTLGSSVNRLNLSEFVFKVK